MQYRHKEIVVLVILLLAIGFILVPDYGRSVDEYLHRVYVNQVLEIIGGVRETSDTLTDLNYYGPAYSLFSKFLTSVFSYIFPHWDRAVGWHFTYFIAFVIGAVSLYSICLRFMKKPAALTAVLLFITQPVYFGHAFINPKDIPFMGLFLLTIAVGFYSSDQLLVVEKLENSGSALTYPFKWFKGVSSGLRSDALPNIWKVIISLSGVALVILFVGWVSGIWLEVLNSGLKFLYFEEAGTIPSNLFRLIAEDYAKTPVEAYSRRLRMMLPWILSIASLVLAGSFAIISSRILPPEFKHKPLSEHKRALFYIVITGILLGLTISIRIGGVFAGLLISLQWILDLRRKFIQPVSFMLIVSAGTAILTWPFLWENTLQRFIETVNAVASFRHLGTHLYEGLLYHAWELPWFYAPKMMWLQLTLPAIALGVFGVIVFLIRGNKRSTRINREIFLVVLWLMLPLVIYFIQRTLLHNNFRQILFITPPIFILSGLAVDQIFIWVKTRLSRAILLSVILFPGLIGIVQLHPYEYIYYNQIIGGVSGAAGLYETDYWCTSQKEAAEYLNLNAEEGARVAVLYNTHITKPYLRDDIESFPIPRWGEDFSKDSADYVLVCSPHAEGFLKDVPIVHKVIKEGATLAVIWKIK